MSGLDLSQFLASFFDEARGRLSSINEGLVAFEAGTLDEEGLIRLRRDAHTIKGSAMMLGVEDVGGVAHVFEDAMEHLIEHPERRTPAMIQFLFDLHDQLAARLQSEDAEGLDAPAARAQLETLMAEAAEGERLPPEAVREQPREEQPADVSETAAPEEALVRAAETGEPDDGAAGAATDEAADAAAGSMGLDMGQFLASFFDEARGRLSSINEGLVAFEAGTLDEEGLIRLRRDAHTIKGSAMMLGVEDVGGVAHVFEDAMEHLIEHPERRTPAMIQFLFDLHDQLAARLQSEDAERLDAPVARSRLTTLLAELEQAGESQAATVDEARAGDEERAASNAEIEAAADESAGVTETNRFRPDLSETRARVSHARGSGRFLRVDADRLDALAGQVIELGTTKSEHGRLSRDARTLSRHLSRAQGMVARLRERLPGAGGDDAAVLEALDRLDAHLASVSLLGRRLEHDAGYVAERQRIQLDDLRDRVLGLMLRPLDAVFATFPRAVRDMAQRYDKKVRLVMAGETVECDQGVVDALTEPLVHLVNNAIAHGIETPEERLRAGKPEAGQVTLAATQSGSEIQIEVVDDGRGIDPDVVRRVAVEKGVTTQAEAEAMDDAEALEMIFRPGFSTRREVDQTAGRGIGMNVVQDTLRRLTGAIRIDTEKGQGTRFIISLPVSIAVQRALLFRMGGQRFGMLTHMLEHVAAPGPGDIEEAEGRRYLAYDGQKVPLVDLRRMLPGDAGAELAEQPMVLIAKHIEGFTGIVVDELYGDAEVIVRELDPYLKRYQAQGLMGNTIAEDGSVVLLIEPYGIKEMGRTAPDARLERAAREARPPEAETEAPARFRALLAEDSIIARQVEKALLESMGARVDTAIDGLDALEKMQRRDYDILITDLEMPRLDGFGLVRRVRNEKRYEDLPILIISTRESAEDRLKGLEAGADAYLVKQKLDQGGLRDALHALLGPLDAGVTERLTNGEESS